VDWECGMRDGEVRLWCGKCGICCLKVVWLWGLCKGGVWLVGVMYGCVSGKFSDWLW